MYLEYIVGPVLALLLGMKFSDYKSKEAEKSHVMIERRLDALEKANEEAPKKMLAMQVPVAQAVKKINEQLGL